MTDVIAINYLFHDKTISASKEVVKSMKKRANLMFYCLLILL